MLLQPYLRRYKKFFLPAGVLVVIVVLSLTFGKKMALGVLEKRDDISNLKKTISQLEGKLAVLNKLSEDDLKKQKDVVFSAVSATSPVLPVISVVKTVGLGSNVLVEDFQVKEQAQMNLGAGGAETADKTRQVDFQFSIIGSPENILRFLNNLGEVLPITQIKKVDISSSDSADISFIAFWQPQPKTLPSISSPVETLTKADAELLKNLAKRRNPLTAIFLVAPDQETQVPPPNIGRTNPFE